MQGDVLRRVSNVDVVNVHDVVRREGWQEGCRVGCGRGAG